MVYVSSVLKYLFFVFRLCNIQTTILISICSPMPNFNSNNNRHNKHLDLLSSSTWIKVIIII